MTVLPLDPVAPRRRRRGRALLVGVLLLAATAGALVPAPAGAAPPAVLGAAGTLTAGQSLRSPDGATELVMQADGNLVVYRAGRARWSTGTTAPGSWLTLQADGNLVVYDGSGRPRWSTGTNPSAADTLVLQDDGNLVLLTRSAVPLWSTYGGRTASRGDALAPGETLLPGQALVTPDPSVVAVMQADGNLVVYRGGVAAWSTRTAVPGSRLVAQTDGNAVVYSPAGVPQWWSATAPVPGVVLVLQADTNLVLYAAGGALWSWQGGLTPRAPGQPRQQIVVTGAYGSSRAQMTAQQWTGSSWQTVASAVAEVGRRGLNDHHVEGDLTTPTGTYGIGPTMFGLSTTVANPRYGYHHIECGDYWSGDQASPTYNSFVHVACGQPGPGGGGASEGLWKETVAYQHFAVIEYNMHPVVPGRGSGIFLHDDTTTGVTAGCVALPPAVLDAVLAWLDPAQSPVIRIGT